MTSVTFQILPIGQYASPPIAHHHNGAMATTAWGSQRKCGARLVYETLSASRPTNTCPLSGDKHLWPGIQLDESFPNGQYGRLCAVVDLQLMENVTHMILDSLFTQIQVIGNFLVRLAVCDQA